MKKLYVLTTIFSSVNYTFEVDSILTDSKKDDVTVLLCDGSVGRCNVNTMGTSLLCRECMKCSKRVLDKIGGVKIKYMNDFLDKNVVHQKFSYKSLKELNKIEYDGFEIGYGISSYFISLTRNLTPLIDDKQKRILDSWLECSMKYTDIANKAITNDYDLVYVVNGRYFDTKPFQEVAFKKGIHTILGESAISIQGKHIRMNFDNIRVHSVSGNTKNILDYWESSTVPIEERRKIAASFFEKRANAIKTNDKVYTKDQQLGLMPADWDSQKTNIAIFNSSEDEFAAIGGEWEKDNLFSSQIEGIRYVLKNTDNPSIHFYLRIHPNLMNIKYKYHTELYNLSKDYDNITVIPGNSPISSYSLLRECDRSITFGSTMGVEAAYAGKSSMVLLPCLHYHLGINYVPKCRQDVLDYINGKVDFIPNKENALKFSYYYYNDERKSVDNSLCEIHNYPITIFGKTINSYGMNYFCSEKKMKYYTLLKAIGIYNSKKNVTKKES